jgi:hypothetical protein
MPAGSVTQCPAIGRKWPLVRFAGRRARLTAGNFLNFLAGEKSACRLSNKKANCDLRSLSREQAVIDLRYKQARVFR